MVGGSCFSKILRVKFSCSHWGWQEEATFPSRHFQNTKSIFWAMRLSQWGSWVLSVLHCTHVGDCKWLLYFLNTERWETLNFSVEIVTFAFIFRSQLRALTEGNSCMIESEKKISHNCLLILSFLFLAAQMRCSLLHSVSLGYTKMFCWFILRDRGSLHDLY